jgi:hypothetical protein
MELNIKQRLMLLSVVPVEGVRMTDLRIARELQLKLGFSEEEQQRFGFVQDGERLEWNLKADVPVDIKIGPRGQVLIRDALKQMEEEKTLTVDHVDLWDLFGCDEDD